MNSENPSLCPECGRPVPATSQHRLCPACLMAQALASQTVFTAAHEKSRVVPPPAPEEIAGKFPQFEILECLGRGGMGAVYKARQKSLNRTVAIKILAPEREHDARFAERFAREAELLAQLSHPHIVTIHDFGEAGGLFYIVMEYVDGVNLRDLLRDGKIAPKQALAIVPPICDALQYAHEKGIVHRDIKPENLLLDREGRVKIADFGIAGLIGAEGESTGTPPYMAPEQSDAKREVDHRADIYALGAVLYEMLTGERPGKEIIAPSRKVQIDVRLDEIVLRALEKKPELRYQHASDVRTMVETIAATHTPPPAEEPASAAAKPGLFGYPFGEYREGRFRPAWTKIILFYLGGAGFTLLFAMVLAVLMRRPALSATNSLFWALLIPLWATVSLILSSRKTAQGASPSGKPVPERTNSKYPRRRVRVALTAACLMLLGAAVVIHRQSKPTARLLARNMLSTSASGYVVANAVHEVLDDLRTRHFMDATGRVRFPDGTSEDRTIEEWGKRSGDATEKLLAFDDYMGRRVTIREFKKSAHDETLIVWEYAGGGDVQDISVIIQKNLVKSGVFLAGNGVLRDFFRFSPAPSGVKPRSIELADSPQLLQKLSKEQLIEVGLAKPLSPWAWQELERRGVTKTDAAFICDGLTAWLKQTAPQGQTQPLSWLDQFLDKLDQQHLLDDAQKLRLVEAVHGEVRIPAQLRIREGAKTLAIQADCRYLWKESILGLTLMNRLQAMSIDGQEQMLAANPDRFWSSSQFGDSWKLPPLAPGSHKLRVEVLSNLVATDDLKGLETIAPPAEWPRGFRRWTRTVEAELVVYPRDAAIVSLTEDPALDPKKMLSVSQVIIRTRGEKAQAVLTFEISDKLPVAVSFDAALRVGGQTIPCGPLWKVPAPRGHTLVQGGSVFEPLPPEMTTADVVLIPNPRYVEGVASVDRIWGREIVLSGVPLQRQDLAASAATSTPGVNAAASAKPDTARVDLLAVSNHPSKGEPWWNPNGTTFTEEPFISTRPRLKAGDDEQVREFAFRVQGPEGATFSCDFEPHSTQTRVEMVQGRDGVRIVTAILPKNARTVNIRAELGLKRWVFGGEYNLRTGRQTADPNCQVSFEPPTETEGQAKVSLVHPNNVRNAQVIALDDQGRQHSGSEVFLESGGPGFSRREYVFPSLSLKRLQTIRFDVPASQSFVFREVPLEPMRESSKKDDIESPPVALKPRLTEQQVLDIVTPVLSTQFSGPFKAHEPYRAEFSKGYWSVHGTVPNGMRGGGAPEATVRDRDGDIVSISLAR